MYKPEDIPPELIPTQIKKLEKWQENGRKKLADYERRLSILEGQQAAVLDKIKALRVRLKRYKMNRRIKEVFYGTAK